MEPWMTEPGAPFVGYGQPSRFEAKVVRTFASAPGTTEMQLRTEYARRSKFWLVTYSMAWNAVKRPLTLPTAMLPQTAVTSGDAK